MFESFAQLFPADWQGAVLTLLAPMRWLAAWQSTIALAWSSGNSAGRVLAMIALLMPALLIAAGMWCTVFSIYTLPETVTTSPGRRSPPSSAPIFSVSAAEDDSTVIRRC